MHAKSSLTAYVYMGEMEHDENDVKIDRQRGLKFYQQGSSETITNVNVAKD